MSCVLLLPRPLLPALANTSLGAGFQWQRAPALKAAACPSEEQLHNRKETLERLAQKL